MDDAHVRSPRVDAAHALALQPTSDAVMSAAVKATGDRLTGQSFVAVRKGDAFRMAHTWRIRDARFRDILVRPGLGLGGLVALSMRPNVSPDYPEDPRITKDFVAMVTDSEGLRSVACVPVMGDGQIEALLYIGHDRIAAISDREIAELERLAAYSELGLRQAAARAQDLEYRRLRERRDFGLRLHHSVAETFEMIAEVAGRPESFEDPERLADVLRLIESSGSAAARELRKTLHHLTRCPPSLAFEARLEAELRAMERASGCTIRTLRYGPAQQLEDPAGTIALDAVMKAITKTQEAASPPLILLALDYRSDRFALELWPLYSTLGEATDAGLEELRADVEALGGRLSISAPSKQPGMLLLELPV